MGKRKAGAFWLSVLGWMLFSSVSGTFLPPQSAAKAAPVEGPPPPVVGGGLWADEFINSSNLSEGVSVEVYGSYLKLKLTEYLNWTQTWTAHFSNGEFFQTAALSDAVSLVTDEGGLYYPTGLYTSTVFDAGRAVDWSSAHWLHSGSFYSVTLEFRTGDVPMPDATWSTWAAPRIRIYEFTCSYAPVYNITDCYSNLGGLASSQYLQYRATFFNANPNTTQSLHEIYVTYGVHPTAGMAVSEIIMPSDLQYWQRLVYTATVPNSTTLVVDVLAPNNTVLLANVSSGADLTDIAQPSLKLRATFQTTDPALSPEVDFWSVQWEVGPRRYFPLILR